MKHRHRKADIIIVSAVAVILLLAGVFTDVQKDPDEDNTHNGARTADTSSSGDLNEKDEKEPSYTEFNGRCIGIRTGSSFEDLTFEYFPDSEYVYFDNDTDLINALTAEKIDGFLDDEPVARFIHTEQPAVDHLKKKLVNDRYCFGFTKGTDCSVKLRTEFNAVLAELKKSGELDRMKQK